MVILDFKNTVRSKAPNQTKGKLEGIDFLNRVWTSLKRVANDVVVMRLIETDASTIKVLRKIDSTTYMRMPEMPLDEKSEVDIEESLLDAVALFIMAGLDRQNSKGHMGLYYREIENANKRLMENETYEDIDSLASDILP